MMDALIIVKYIAVCIISGGFVVLALLLAALLINKAKKD